MPILFAVLFLSGFALAQTPRQPFGVCPPFPLRDETGAVINPAADPKVSVPYSPKQTCGAPGCHDYGKITEGFHFQQGRGEKPPAALAERYQWVSSPGNYGGNWCSPAPLYRQLAPKRNTNTRMIDMTSFDFVTATCGNCHPGGGPPRRRPDVLYAGSTLRNNPLLVEILGNVTALVGARASFLPFGEFTGALGALARARAGA